MLLNLLSTYIIRIKTIKISFNIIKNIQILMADKILKSDTSFIISKHSGKFISNFTNRHTIFYWNVINGIAISFHKRICYFNSIAWSLMFYQNWQLSILAIIMIPVAAFFYKKIWKKNEEICKSRVFKLARSLQNFYQKY